MSKFLNEFKLQNEFSRSDHGKIYEAKRKSDGSLAVVKIISKLGVNKVDLDELFKGIDFWKSNSHPKITEVTAVYNDDTFIYICYDFPQGGDLASIVINSNITFTEGFACNLTKGTLSTLAFLHSHGLSHGGCLPINIVYYFPITCPGWVHSGKLSFFPH